MAGRCVPVAVRPRFRVPVFAAVGVGAWGAVQELRAQPELQLVSSPRHASLLLVAGAVAEDHAEALDRVHDQIPHPRRTVAWVGRPAEHPVASTVVTDPSAVQITSALVDAHIEVTRNRSLSEVDRLPDEEPNEWRGVGPHGQGGEGMMGGRPYGRPLAMTGDDRDGLALDQLDLRLGPFLDALPPGMVLDVTMQGEVLQAVEVARPRIAASPIGSPLSDEVAGWDDDARGGLRWLAQALHVQGLDAYASRAASLAAAPRRDDAGGSFASLRRAIRRSGLPWALRGVGKIEGMGDAADRWAARLDRIDAALSGHPPPTGAGRSATSSELAEAMTGMTLTDAITTIVSLDLASDPTERRQW